MEFEIILVNDEIPDDSWVTILEIAHADTRVKGINFSRNIWPALCDHGWSGSLQGEWIVVMDCDLQDQPEEITNIYNEAKKVTNRLCPAD
jgi:dolichol-phosphate mannosyltransferase